MKVKTVSLRFLALIGCIGAATILMGMMSKPSQPNALATQFAEILNALPKSGQNIIPLRNGLNTVHASLLQNQLPLAFNLLQDMQGNFKNMQFTTDLGTFSGEQLIDIYFGDFIRNLDAKIKAQTKLTAPISQTQISRPPAPTAVQSIQKTTTPPLSQQFAEILQNLPSTGKNIPLFKETLATVQNMLQQPNPNLPDVLSTLQKIKQGPLKDAQVDSPDLGIIPGDQFLAMYLDNFIKMVQLEIQASQPHIAGRPFGLVNKENSCFMNSSIQALASLERLTTALLKHAFDDFYKPNSISAGYIKLLNTMQNHRTAVIDPLPFCLLGWNLFPGQMGHQQDASEFIQLLLESLAENTRERADINLSRSPQGTNPEVISLFQIKMTQRSYDEAGDRVFRRDKNGAIISDDETHLIVPPIDIQPNNKTLLDCLQNIFTVETHPSHATRKKVTALLSASNYFLIRLLRETNVGGKNEQPISFPLDNFDISALSITGQAFPLYRCKAFIIHIGDYATIGHYIAYIRKGNDWFLCDDTNVTPVTLSDVQNFANQGTIDSAMGKLTPIMFFYEQQ